MTDWASVRSRPKTLNELQFRDWPPDPLHPISPTDEFAPLELGADGALLWKGCDEPPRLLLAAGCSAIISPRRPGFVITSRNAKPRHDTQPGLGDGLRGDAGGRGGPSRSYNARRTDAVPSNGPRGNHQWDLCFIELLMGVKTGRAPHYGVPVEERMEETLQ